MPEARAAWSERLVALDASAALAEREEAFRTLVDSHAERAFRLAWRLMGGDAAAAEDVAQEAFFQAYRGLAAFRGEAELSTWFYRILVRQAARQRRRRELRELAWRLWARGRESRAGPPAGDPRLRERIGRAVAALPRGQREAFVLVHLEGFTLSEAAAATGRRVGTLKTHLHRALVRLRRELEDVHREVTA